MPTKPMSGEQYDRALTRLGFSNRGFCLEVLGVEERTGRRWKEAEQVPASLAFGLQLAIALKLDAAKIRELLKID